MRLNLILLTLLSGIILSSCWYDNEEDLFGAGSCPTENMSYSNDILPILENGGCVSCHTVSAGNGVVFESYDGTKATVDNGKLISSIKWDGNASQMPQGGAQLDPCLINKIEAWISQGTLNN